MSDTIHPFSPLMEETLKQFHAVEIANNRTATEWDNVTSYTKEIYRREVYRNQAAALRTQLAEAQARIEVMTDYAAKARSILTVIPSLAEENRHAAVSYLDDIISPTAGQSLLEEVTGLRDVIKKWLPGFRIAVIHGTPDNSVFSLILSDFEEALKKGGK